MPSPPTPARDGPVVEVRRSRKRRRTVAAYRDGEDRVVVLMPARFSRAQEAEWVATMLARLERSEKRRRPSDDDLARRAAALSDRYLDGRAVPLVVRWAEQRSRWGSCTPADRSVRLSTRLQGMPAWVVDYVLVHELAHLVEEGHSVEFWAWVDRYPKAERARGFLEGVAAAGQRDLGSGWSDVEPTAWPEACADDA